MEEFIRVEKWNNSFNVLLIISRELFTVSGAISNVWFIYNVFFVSIKIEKLELFERRTFGEKSVRYRIALTGHIFSWW